jgi:hypothetical protein
MLEGRRHKLADPCGTDMNQVATCISLSHTTSTCAFYMAVVFNTLLIDGIYDPMTAIGMTDKEYIVLALYHHVPVIPMAVIGSYVHCIGKNCILYIFI